MQIYNFMSLALVKILKLDHTLGHMRYERILSSYIYSFTQIQIKEGDLIMMKMRIISIPFLKHVHGWMGWCQHKLRDPHMGLHKRPKGSSLYSCMGQREGRECGPLHHRKSLQN